jgi:hypothetical protein
MPITPEQAGLAILELDIDGNGSYNIAFEPT